MQKDKFDRAGTHWRETYSKIKYSDVFGLNGQAVGITEQGDVELIKEGGEFMLLILISWGFSIVAFLFP